MHFPVLRVAILGPTTYWLRVVVTLGVPICFLIWTVLVTVTLFRVVLMFQKAQALARNQGFAVAATFQAWPWQKHSAMHRCNHQPGNKFDDCSCTWQFHYIIFSFA